jgi:predicted DNA-binding ribbon-helix-helix protein
MPRKLIEFHAEDLRALSELAEDRSATVQELVDEAIRDLLKKHGKPTDLTSALRESAKQARTTGGA